MASTRPTSSHAEYLRGLQSGSSLGSPREFLESMARPAGDRLGVRFAVTAEVIDL
jgi:hypothetical protein